MTRTTATFSVSLPPKMAAELERVRKTEHRTRSELVREALRHYMRDAAIRGLRDRIAQLPEEEAAADELEAIKEGSAELRKDKHLTSTLLRHELHGTRKQPRAKKP